MSYKTRYITGNRLKILNDRLEDAGYPAVEEGYAVNIVNKFNAAEQPEVEEIIQDVTDMTNREVNEMAGRIVDMDEFFEKLG